MNVLPAESDGRRLQRQAWEQWRAYCALQETGTFVRVNGSTWRGKAVVYPSLRFQATRAPVGLLPP